MFWGYSPALDLLNEILESNLKLNDDEIELNILIIGASDCRHVLKTISKYYKHIENYGNKKIRLNFYICEVLLELVARQLLLLLIAFEPPEVLGLKEKIRLFMEVYGNTLVRPKTATYIYKKTFQLIHCVTDLNYLNRRLPVINLNLLKYKERDSLETIFKFWQESKTFTVTQIWNKRLRQSLGVRYDSKEGVYDWDYHMKLKDRPDGSRINSREYRKWRDSGIAFTWLETEVSETNPTLTCGIFRYGDKILHYGYLGDIVNGPYMTFGLQCEDDEMLKTVNGIYAKRATDITERNLSRLFWEIQNNTPYVHPKEKEESSNLGVVITELTETSVKVNDEPSIYSNEPNLVSDIGDVLKNLNIKETYSSIELLPDIRIIFLPLNSINDITSKQNYQNYFHLIWLSQNLSKQFSSKFMPMLINNGIILIENRLYIINLSKDEFDKYPDTLNDIFISSGCSYYKKFDYKKDTYAKLTVERK